MSTFKYYKNGQWNYVNGAITGDTLPIGSEVDFDGETVPAGWEETADPNEYSTTPKIVGTWIDGEPIYRKVVDLGTLVNTNTKLVSSGLTGDIYPIKVYGFAIKTAEMFPLPFVWGDTSSPNNYCGLFYDRANNQFYFRTNRDMSTYNGIAIIEFVYLN